MSFACPHCTKPIDGVVDQATFTQRLAEKTRAADEANAKAATNQQAADELARIKPEFGRSQDALALARQGINDDRHVRQLRGAYNADTEGLAPDKKPAFGDWLKGDGAETVARFKGTAAPTAPTQPAKPGDAPQVAPANPASPAPVVVPPVNPNGGAAPPTVPATPTIDQVRAKDTVLAREYMTATPDRRKVIQTEREALKQQATTTSAGSA